MDIVVKYKPKRSLTQSFQVLFLVTFKTSDENQFVRQQKVIFYNPVFDLQCP